MIGEVSWGSGGVIYGDCVIAFPCNRAPEDDDAPAVAAFPAGWEPIGWIEETSPHVNPAEPVASGADWWKGQRRGA